MDISKIRDLFPLVSFESVITLFKKQLEDKDKDPDLSLLSICLGFIENVLCKENTNRSNTFPILDYETVDTLYKKFKSIVAIAETSFQQSSEKKSKKKDDNKEPKVATREKIKKISDVIWNSLLRSSYKDRAHLQSVYSYLTGNKLDSFGVALVTVAACQILNYKDVHLALSEDHVWIVFGITGDETMEITWHGKGAEDKRGHSVIPGIEAQTWLYLAGHPIICTRYTELAAMVLSLNPQLNQTSVCAEIADLQQQLLWILYDAGHLSTYPMGIGTLGELEESHPTEDRPSCEQLYEEAIQSAITHYSNHHVYPYSYKGSYYYRRENFRDAFRCWADASDVIRLYNYSRDDEEIYKEFLDIANEQIPQIMKTESSGHSAKSILRDPYCFGNLLKFYDGICQWEEGSHTPILHIGWAKQLCYTISKFDYDIRSQVKIIIKSDYDDDNNNKKNEICSTNDEQKHEAKDENMKCEESMKSPKIEEKVFSPASRETLASPQSMASSQLASPSTASVDDNRSEVLKSEEDQSNDTNNNGKSEHYDDFEINTPKKPIIALKSRKMKGLKDLLLAEKLNTNAISLQITAQSHIGKKSRSSIGIEDNGADAARPKRSRRE
ncbi:CLUMA_CG014406, isoform A [Clunio marinus]|uniref:Menin n=1 Tax=Clunio marinus TaxID=568069 RepID=A0A1J1IRX6_9DIPT|nr:CLUMA_CG014406, isoform A [Clunio marinus]